MNALAFAATAFLSALSASWATPFLGYGGLGGLSVGGAESGPVAVASSPVSVVSQAKSTNIGPVYSGHYGYGRHYGYGWPVGYGVPYGYVPHIPHAIGYYPPYPYPALVPGLGLSPYGYGLHAIGVGYGGHYI